MLLALRKALPRWLKKTLRFARYSEDRANFFRERIIRKAQNKNIRLYFDRDCQKLIIFFVPGADRITGKETISGGVISLVSLCEQTRKLEDIHKSKTLMCTFPDEFLLLKHTNFENDVEVYRFDQVTTYFPHAESVLIHLPDDLAGLFLDRLSKPTKQWLEKVQNLHVNIVNANILLMPTIEIVQQIKEMATKVTMTAAHVKYCSAYYRRFFGMPLHLFSTWVSPEQYFFKGYKEKENIIVVSPDSNPAKDSILSILESRPELEIITLKGLTHDEFKKTIASAKWALTFGEGLDGYFVEPVFSGTFAFAVYNEDFFTEDFKNLPGIFSNYRDLAENIILRMEQVDGQEIYTSSQKKQFELCARYYSYNRYQNNIKEFYTGDYTYP